MDFSAWPPSHTILIAMTIVGVIGQFAVLFYRTKILERRMELLENQIDKQIEEQGETFFRAMEHLENRIDKRIDDVRGDMGNLTQYHIDHLSHHER